MFGNFAINQQAVLGWNSQSGIITFLASFLIWLMFGGLIILWVVDGKTRKKQSFYAFVTALLSWVISQMLKNLLPSARPYALNGGAPLTLTTPLDGAFPSAHAAVAFGLATTIWFHNRKLGVFYLTLAFLVSAGRVLANVHYILDILGGSLLGMMVAVLVDRLRTRRLDI